MIPPSGPIPAKIMIVGEAPGADEEHRGEPFVGMSGMELTRMLADGGINRSECFITNVCRVRPPGNDISAFIAKTKKERTLAHVALRDKYVLPPIVEGYNLLQKEVRSVRPNIILALGNTPLWALTGNWGITKWRGSMLYSDFEGRPRVIPTYHPAAILRQWDWRAIAVYDIKRAARFRNGEPYPQPKWNFIIRPSYDRARETLVGLLDRARSGPLRLSFDLETRLGHIACAGLSWSLTEAICIPFMCVESKEGYWMAEQEADLVHLLYRLLTHPNAQVIGQNLLYDSQYTYRHWHFIPRVAQDTMISHHVAFAGLPKKLDFQASIYCDSYRYWKDDSKNWNPKMGEEQLWVYNCEDCVRTDEVAVATKEACEKLNLSEVDRFQQDLFWPVLRAMNLGVRIDTAARDKMAMDLMEAIAERETWFTAVLGHPLNPRSPKQMQSLFYTDLRLPVQHKRGTGNVTLDEEALQRLGAKEPLIRPLVKRIIEHRSLGVFLSTFIRAPLDVDGRMRCSFNICGAETYRFSSSENAFGSGTNLQNLPKGSEYPDPDGLSFPNVRKLFIPDPGYVFFDMDLDRADLQVVVWEADDLELKAMLREGVDIHAENAKALGITRQLAKSWVHGTNYGGSPRTMAINCGLTTHAADRMQKRWFEIHPGIKRWHERTEHQLKTRRYVENRFGYRRFYFERVEGILPEALAWQPQSTVACVINRAWVNIHRLLPEVQVLLQVHDSLAGQFPSGFNHDRLLGAARVVIPYGEPLIIPVGLKMSEKSWGDCK